VIADEVTTADIIAIIGAILGGIGGILIAWAALIRARHESNDECRAKLQALRLENEKVADELHQLRMKATEEP
jgi:hypothetical protein